MLCELCNCVSVYFSIHVSVDDPQSSTMMANKKEEDYKDSDSQRTQSQGKFVTMVIL
jgi:hypothetical protein